MKKMILFFSHELTPEQINEAEQELGVEKFVELPQELQRKWSQIEPYKDTVEMKSFFDFLSAKAEKEDYVLIQGDYGATYSLVRFAQDKNFIPIYATAVRGENVEINNLNGNRSVQFKHCRFRRYE
jgi:hypothetical protein